MEGHDFNNYFVSYCEGNWRISDINTGISGDCFVKRLDEDTFRAYFSGMIPIDSSFKDD